MSDRETLARVIIPPLNDNFDDYGPTLDAPGRIADAILASDWLASVRAEAERAGMMRAATMARKYRNGQIIADIIEAAAPAGETADNPILYAVERPDGRPGAEVLASDLETADATIFGFPVKINTDLPSGVVRFEVDGIEVGRIVNATPPAKEPSDG